MKGHSRRTLTVFAIVLALVLLAALNTFAALELGRYRLDLTEEQAYTLSPGTRRLLEQLDEPISLRLYVSRAVRENSPFLAAYAERVRDFLEGYVDASGGRIQLETVDPEPYSEEEDRAVGFGLRAIQLDAETSGYFGLVGTNSTDDVAVIPILSPERERFLEYDVTRLIYRLAYPERPVVALLSGLPLNADPTNQFRPWRIYELLQDQFQLRWLAGEVRRIEDDVQVLLLVHPQGLSDVTLYAIDQYVLRGGKLMVLVDPHAEAQAMRRQQPGAGDTSSTLDKLFDAWGIVFDKDRLVADPLVARQVQMPLSGGRVQVLDYLAWLALTGDRLDRQHPITADLERIHLASAGALERAEGAEGAWIPLLVSSDQAQLVDAESQRLFPDPLGLLRNYRPDGKVRVLAAILSGRLPSAFPEGPPEDAEAAGEGREPQEAAEDGEGPRHLAEAQAEATVIVVADTDLLEDRSWLVRQRIAGREVELPIADNADFLANALDWLAGSEVLVQLRGRQLTFRPFERLVELRRQAEQRYRAKEQELVQRLEELQNKLRSLELPVGEGDGTVLDARLREEIERIRDEILETRRELREVRRRLREDIERLQTTVRFANIGAVPLLVALIAVGVGLVRRHRMRRQPA